MTRILLLTLVMVVCSCRAIREENQLINLVSENGKYTVMFVYHDREKRIVGAQRRGKNNIRFDGFGDSFVTYYYQFDGTDWKPCDEPSEQKEKRLKRMMKGVK